MGRETEVDSGLDSDRWGSDKAAIWGDPGEIALSLVDVDSGRTLPGLSLDWGTIG